MIFHIMKSWDQTSVLLSVLRTHPRTPLCQQKQAWAILQAVRLSAHSPPLGGRRAQLSKENCKITLSICSAMSEFIETKLFNKISLDLNSGERTRSAFFSYWNYLRHFQIPRFSGTSNLLHQIRGYPRPVELEHSKEGQREPCSISPDLIGCEE